MWRVLCSGRLVTKGAGFKMQTHKFAGANKTNTSFLSPLERRVAPIVLPWIPGWLETYHLTMLTLLWSGLILVFSYLAAGDPRWLWGVSVMIALQWVTDFFDGSAILSSFQRRQTF